MRYRTVLGLALTALVATVAKGQDTTITVKAFSSTLEFVPARVTVKAGTRLTLKFVNEGTYAHNIVIPKKEDDIDALAQNAMNAGDTGFVPLAMKDKMYAWTSLISPGGTGDLTFVVPAAGSYFFVCMFPGHAETMLGTIRALK